MRKLSLAAALSALALSAVGCDFIMGGPPRSTCIEDRQLPLSSTFQEDLAETDCNADGAAVDFYRVMPSAPVVFSLSFTTQGAVSTSVLLQRVTSASTVETVSFESGSEARTSYYALGPGVYVLRIEAATQRGPYQITTQTIPAPGPVSCVVSSSRSFFIAVGSVVGGAITANDCDAGVDRVDAFRMYVSAGRTYTLSFTPAMASRVEVLDGVDVEASATAPAGQATTLTFTPAAARLYTIRVLSAAVGGYTLGVQ